MPPIGKELEHQPSLDDVAVREVEGYIERVERQVEAPPKDSQTPVQPPQPQQQNQVADMGKIVAAQFGDGNKPNIVLPLNKTDIENGLKLNVYNGVRWLSEWCVYMIKKYPGRVFYLPPSTNQ